MDTPTFLAMHATLPAMIRDLLTTGDDGAKLANAQWLAEIIARHLPEGFTAAVAPIVPDADYNWCRHACVKESQEATV